MLSYHTLLTVLVLFSSVYFIVLSIESLIDWFKRTTFNLITISLIFGIIYLTAGIYLLFYAIQLFFNIK